MTVNKQGTHTVEVGRFQLYDSDHVRSVLKSQSSRMPKDLQRYYRSMLTAGGERILASPASLDCLADMDDLCPNFSQVSEEVRGALALSLLEGGPIRVPPILLLGKPGIGKTHYARKLSQALGAAFSYISMSSVTAAWVIGGASRVWQDAHPGKVSRVLIENQVSNPWMLIDEIDKVSSEAKYDPIGALYTLLEPETAEMFRDEYLEIPVDARNITWVATANDEREIPTAIQSRLTPFFIQAPNQEEIASIAENQYKKLLTQYPRSNFDPEMSPSVVERLSRMTPRDIHGTIISALGRAVVAKRRHLIPEDIRQIGGRSAPIGF